MKTKYIIRCAGYDIVERYTVTCILTADNGNEYIGEQSSMYGFPPQFKGLETAKAIALKFAHQAMKLDGGI